MWRGAEMGDSLPAVALGTGRSAVAVSTGYDHTCVLLVSCRGEGSGVMMNGWKGSGCTNVILTQLTAAAAR